MTKSEILQGLNFITQSIVHIEEILLKVESEVERITAAVEAEEESD